MLWSCSFVTSYAHASGLLKHLTAFRMGRKRPRILSFRRARFSDLLRENPHPEREVELWKVKKGERELTCIAVYQAYGIDVRLMEGDGFRRTRLVRDSRGCTTLSDEWKTRLIERGWQR